MGDSWRYKERRTGKERDGERDGGRAKSKALRSLMRKVRRLQGGHGPFGKPVGQGKLAAPIGSINDG